VNVFADSQEQESILVSADLLPLLPDVPAVREWVADELGSELNDSYVFGDLLLFNSRDAGVEGLWAADLSNPSLASFAVHPAEFSKAWGFTEFEGKLFFAAKTSSGDQLWYADSAASLNGSAQLFFEDLDHGLSISEFLLHGDSMYIKVSWLMCDWPFWYPGLLQLQNSSMTSYRGATTCARPSQGSLIGELCVAILPVVLLSAWLIRSYPGLCVILFFSLYGFVVVIRLIADGELETLYEFLTTSATVYSSLGYLLVMWLHCRGRHDEWSQDLNRWSSVVVSASFAASVQLRLDVPLALHEDPQEAGRWQSDAWRWIVYLLCGFLLQLLGSVAKRRVPAMTGYLMLLLVIGKSCLEFLDSFTTIRESGVAAQRALQLLALALVVGAVPVPGAVPHLFASPAVQPEEEEAPKPIKVELKEDEEEAYKKTKELLEKQKQLLEKKVQVAAAVSTAAAAFSAAGAGAFRPPAQPEAALPGEAEGHEVAREPTNEAAVIGLEEDSAMGSDQEEV